MDILGLLTGAVGALAGVPIVGKYLAIVVAAGIGLHAVVTGLVVAWHGLVKVLAVVWPAEAEKLKASEATVDEGSNKILAFIDRISSLPVPQAPAQKPQT